MTLRSKYYYLPGKVTLNSFQGPTKKGKNIQSGNNPEPDSLNPEQLKKAA
jgi:hypothetical protein